jgi:hypothetical protein
MHLILSRWQSRLGITIMIWLLAGFAHAAEIPSWLGQDSGKDVSLQDNTVWLVLAGSEDINHAFEGMKILAVPTFASGDYKRYLSDLRLDYAKDDMTFQFGREQIAYIRFYGKWNFSLNGAPMVCSYAPVIRLRNGQSLEGKRKTVFPEQALAPWKYRYEKTVTVDYYGQSQERREESAFSTPVLALAWSRADAEAARDEILLRLVGHDMVRTHVDWGGPREVYLADGKAEVEVHAHYDTKYKFSINWQQERVEGTIILSINGRKQTFDFYNTCVASNGKCGPHVRVAKWEKDTSGNFQNLYFDQKGVWLFYRASQPVEQADRVDPRKINVRLQVRP